MGMKMRYLVFLITVITIFEISCSDKKSKVPDYGPASRAYDSGNFDSSIVAYSN